MSGEAGLPPGWYPHAQAPNALRYWDGTQWTEGYAPMHGGQPRRERLPEWLTTIGFIAMILFPIGGFAIGAIHLAKDETSDGAMMVVGSLIAGVFWLYVFSSAMAY